MIFRISESARRRIGCALLRTRRAGVASSIAIWISVLGLAGITAAQPTSVTVISYPARPPKLPLWLARDAGLFERQGLNVSIKELNTSEELIESLKKREGQIYAATANWLV